VGLLIRLFKILRIDGPKTQTMIDRRGSLARATCSRIESPRLGPAYKEVLQDFFTIRSGGRLFANLAMHLKIAEAWVRLRAHERLAPRQMKSAGPSFSDFAEQFMIFKVKMLLSILSLLLFVAPSAAADFTYQEYTKAPEVWKRGFVFGIARYMSTVAQPDEQPPYPVRTAFQRCLASSTDTLLVPQVEAYVAANPASSTGPMVAIIMRAFFNLCRAEIEKAQPPKGAPSQR